MPVTHIGPARAALQSQDDYVTNNPYQVRGPRGFTEFKLMDDTNDLFVRLDFPGVAKDGVKVLFDHSNKKTVVVLGNAPKLSHDSFHRVYVIEDRTCLCDCCEISKIHHIVKDGVVRLILSKQKINFRVSLPCFGAVRMPPVYPSLVSEGPRCAFESKLLPEGSCFLRIDMPGVPKDNFKVEVETDGCVTVIGRAPLAMYDSSEREYRGKVAVEPGFDNSRIEVIVKLDGVIRLIIPPF